MLTLYLFKHSDLWNFLSVSTVIVYTVYPIETIFFKYRYLYVYGIFSGKVIGTSR